MLIARGRLVGMVASEEIVFFFLLIKCLPHVTSFTATVDILKKICRWAEKWPHTHCSASNNNFYGLAAHIDSK